MEKTKVLILGGTGMLGSAVGTYFLNNLDRYDVTLTARNKSMAYGDLTRWNEYDPTSSDPTKNTVHVGRFDVVINCIGIIKPMMAKSMKNAVLINSLLPHVLAEQCAETGTKFIHISTDCVYSGFKGKYKESDLHDCLDAYGKSKSLGEPTSNAMVIRTSIIGPEIHNNSSLVAWAQSQAGKKVNGFRNHLWNGVTTKQFGNICDQILSKGLYEIGLHHVHSDVVNKYQLLNHINDRYKLNLDIQEVDGPEAIDRSMSTERPLLSHLSIPSLRDQILSM